MTSFTKSIAAFVAVLFAGVGICPATSFTFTGSAQGVSASGTADFEFVGANQLQIMVADTTMLPNQITQAVQGINWTFSTAVSGSETFAATVTPINIASNGSTSYVISAAPHTRAITQGNPGWVGTTTSLITSNTDMIRDVPISNQPNGSLTNMGGPSQVVSPVTFLLTYNSNFTPGTTITGATMRWGTGSSPEISAPGIPIVPQLPPTPLPASVWGGLALLGVLATMRKFRRRSSVA